MTDGVYEWWGQAAGPAGAVRRDGRGPAVLRSRGVTVTITFCSGRSEITGEPYLSSVPGSG
ncbi:hypothetical protein GCM10017744_025900 [Streptomyces antimycoticus]